MKNWIKKHWKFLMIVAIILFPVILNFTLLLRPPFGASVIGTPEIWLNYWGVFISSLIGAFVSFYILKKTIDSNHKENKANRELQLNTFSYQCYLTKIETYKEVVLEALDVFSIKNCETIANSVKKSLNITERKNFANSLIDTLNEVSNKFRITFASDIDETEQEYLDFFEDQRVLFGDLIKDLIWIGEIPNMEYDCYDNPKEDIIRKRIKEYKEEEEQKGTIQNKQRIWNVVNDGFRIDKFPHSIVDELLKCNTYDIFYSTSKEFIKYENSKAQNILNGTEQSK